MAYHLANAALSRGTAGYNPMCTPFRTAGLSGHTSQHPGEPAIWMNAPQVSIAFGWAESHGHVGLHPSHHGRQTSDARSPKLF